MLVSQFGRSDLGFPIIIMTTKKVCHVFNLSDITDMRSSGIGLAVVAGEVIVLTDSPTSHQYAQKYLHYLTQPVKGR